MAGQVWRYALHGRVSRSDVPRVDASLIARMKDMAEQNRRLERMYAGMSMQNELLKEAIGKSHKAVSASTDGREGGRHAGGTCRAGLPHISNQ